MDTNSADSTIYNDQGAHEAALAVGAVFKIKSVMTNNV